MVHSGACEKKQCERFFARHRSRYWPRFARYALGIAALVSGPLGITDAVAQFSLVSVAHDGGVANGASTSSAISGDGRFVAFASAATNLIANDTNASNDVFVRDRQANVTTRVSVTSAGAEASGNSTLGGITPDGRFVVFSSYGSLVAGDTNACATPAGVPTCEDIYVHDRQTSTTTRISVSTGGAQSDGHSTSPSISADGRYVLFTSEASNLVAGDTNGQPDVFLRDLETNTTTRVSVNGAGGQMPRGGTSGLISADGEVIVFNAWVAPQEAIDPETCDQAISLCRAVYQRLRSTGVTTLISNAFPSTGFGLGGFQFATMFVRAMSADGRIMLVEQSGASLLGTPGKRARERTLVHDTISGRTTSTPWGGWFSYPSHRILNISPDGRTLAHYTNMAWPLFRWSDRVSGVSEEVQLPNVFLYGNAAHVETSTDARFMAFSTGSAMVAGDTNSPIEDVYVYDRDAGDADGLPDAWETTFGQNPSNAADALADPDLDGLTNLQEYQRGSHPNATHTRYFAEGAANAFFATQFAVLNPGDTEAKVVLRYLGQNGQVSSKVLTLPARRPSTVLLTSNSPDINNDFSTVVESDQRVVVDRTMTWGAGWGGHAETSISAPSTTWHLAEGATHGAFDLFYLFQNPNPTTARVTVTYLRLDPATPVVRTYDVPANSRRTIWVDEEGPELAAVDVGASITSDLPIVVERAMYSTRPGQPSFAAGHGGAGITAPAPKWFLAEGATGQFFDTYLLIANPNAAASDVKVTYLLGSGSAAFSKLYTVAGQTRKTLSIKDEDPRLADTVVSMIVETTNNQPLVVERAMWWPRDQWYEAHLSAGATETGTRWALADGVVNADADTYILIANTSGSAGMATVTLLGSFGAITTAEIPLPANSRINVACSTLLPPGIALPQRFGALVESNGVDIVVERSMYRTVDSVLWSVGTAALATKLQ
jgi:hypothetical protein